MASIGSLGVGSGLLTTELLDSIIASEREASDLRLDQKEAVIDARITAYGAVQSVLDNLYSAANALAESSTITKTTASASDSSVLSATTSSTAITGTYSLNISSIAKAHTLASQRYTSITDSVGTGTMTIKFGSTTYDANTGDYDSFTQNADAGIINLKIDSSNNTLAGIRDAINKADGGVTASIVNDGQGYRLLLTSDETGESNSMEITVNGDAGLQSLAYNSAQNDENSNMMETQAAQSAALKVNGLSITSESNQLTEVIKGVTLNLTSDTDGKDVTLTVARDVSAASEDMEAFISAYNDYKDIYDTLTAFEESDDEEDVKTGILLGDSTLRSIQYQVKRTLLSVVDGLGGDYQSLADIGITTNKDDDYKLVFNSSVFETALQDDANNVAGVLANSKTATDSLVSIISLGRTAQPGSYDVEITQAATQAKVEGLSVDAFDFASSVVIGGSNDSFTVNLNGTSAAITLEHGQYSSGDELALMIQSAINNNSTISESGSSISVEFNSSEQRLEFTSSKYGSASSLSFSNLDATVSNTLGIGAPGQGGVNGSFFSSLSDTAFGATTAPGSGAISEKDSYDFSSNTMTFDLVLSGTAANDGTYSITLDEDMSDVVNTNGEVTTDRTRDDMLSYINSELASAGLAGVVTASFTSAGRIVFSSTPEAGSQTLELTNVVASNMDFLGLGDAAGTSTSGVTVPAGTTFEIDYSNSFGTVESGTVTVPAGTYETGDDLAAAIQSAINGDANIAAGAQAAQTVKGLVDLSSDIDFGTNAYGFSFDWNGTQYDVLVDTFDTDNLTSIQNAIDAAMGGDAGNVVASLSSNGLVLSTANTGSNQEIQILSDGQGDTTTPGAAINAGIDFSASPSTFSLTVDGQELTVTLDDDVSTSVEDTLAYIQGQLDTTLANYNGGGVFAAGDIVAKLDDSNQIYFETVSKNGEKTSATFGADASIYVSSADANTTATLGLTTGSPNLNGFNAFGLSLGSYVGFDSQSTVSYSQNSDGNGGFLIKFDNNTTVDISNPSVSAAALLGLYPTDSSSAEGAVGVDVEGTINGIKATGKGQYLTAGKGDEAATNGYVLGDPGADFSSAVVIDSSNKTFRIKVDGVESQDITLTEGTYASSDDLIAEIKEQINADKNLSEKDLAVDIKYDEDTAIFGIFSVSTGTDSTVRLTSISDGLSSILGMSSATAGVDGKDATGEENPAAGIILKIEGTTTGSRGSVNYIQGIFGELSAILDDMLDSNGVIETKLSNLDDQKTQLEDEKDRLDKRMDAYYERLSASFIYNDALISTLNTTEDYLAQQFESMNSSDD
ncbi:flagellar filament capping protein FliD [Gynuella sunshinyii]|uniref:Filament cap protein n=1 Tax=Gynuella sunshinyii YC6258 TaxID=1445510 RepID=A0A0C5VSP9_9GAMM|nr:flagellar filament capping protein FliD [Gynuella sunshinyii]AJQ96363.1 flagellar capping protein [Gynuella sunshinyii YC6258]